MPDKKQSESVASSAVPQPERPQWTPAVEEVRKLLMEKFSDRFSMERIAEAAYIIGGARPERPWSECPRCDDGLYNGKECAVCWGTGRVTERLVTHICGQPERPDQWAGDQWEAATWHLLRCELPTIADCRFCRAIKEHLKLSDAAAPKETNNG